MAIKRYLFGRQWPFWIHFVKHAEYVRFAVCRTNFIGGVPVSSKLHVIYALPMVWIVVVLYVHLA
jgi:hypothetical protein